MVLYAQSNAPSCYTQGPYSKYTQYFVYVKHSELMIYGHRFQYTKMIVN